MVGGTQFNEYTKWYWNLHPHPTYRPVKVFGMERVKMSTGQCALCSVSLTLPMGGLLAPYLCHVLSDEVDMPIISCSWEKPKWSLYLPKQMHSDLMLRILHEVIHCMWECRLHGCCVGPTFMWAGWYLWSLSKQGILLPKSSDPRNHIVAEPASMGSRAQLPSEASPTAQSSVALMRWWVSGPALACVDICWYPHLNRCECAR